MAKSIAKKLISDGKNSVFLHYNVDDDGFTTAQIEMDGYYSIRSEDTIYLVKKGEKLPAKAYMNRRVDFDMGEEEMSKPVRAVGDKVSLAIPEEPPHGSVVVSKVGIAYQSNKGIWKGGTYSLSGLQWVSLLNKFGEMEVVYIGKEDNNPS